MVQEWLLSLGIMSLGLKASGRVARCVWPLRSWLALDSRSRPAVLRDDPRAAALALSREAQAAAKSPRFGANRACREVFGGLPVRAFGKGDETLTGRCVAGARGAGCEALIRSELLDFAPRHRRCSSFSKTKASPLLGPRSVEHCPHSANAILQLVRSRVPVSVRCNAGLVQTECPGWQAMRAGAISGLARHGLQEACAGLGCARDWPGIEVCRNRATSGEPPPDLEGRALQRKVCLGVGFHDIEPCHHVQHSARILVHSSSRNRQHSFKAFRS